MPSHNPLVISLPYTFSNQDVPTEIMANRFSAWRSIIKDLVNYFKEYSSVQEEIIRQQSRYNKQLDKLQILQTTIATIIIIQLLTVRLKLSITFSYP